MTQEIDQQGHVRRPVVVRWFEEDDFVRHGVKTQFRMHRGEFAAVDDDAPQSARLTQGHQQGVPHLRFDRGERRYADGNDFDPRLPLAYLSFVTTMFIAFGATFEVPVAVVVLSRMGVVPIEKLKSFRSYFIVLAFIVAAVLTPPDVVSQLSLALPMCLLYEIGIFAAVLVNKQARQDEEKKAKDQAAEV